MTATSSNVSPNISLKKIKEERRQESHFNNSDESNSIDNSVEEIKEFEPVYRDTQLTRSIQFPPSTSKASGFTSALMKSKIKDFECINI
jgi:hypothetical protein